MNHILKYLFALIFIIPQLVSGTENRDSNHPLGARLADCGSFFELLSKSRSKFANEFKIFSIATMSYAIIAFPDFKQAQIEISKSMINLTNELPKIQNDQGAFKQKFDDCIATLKIGETELRPQMDDIMKSLVPEIYGGSLR